MMNKISEKKPVKKSAVFGFIFLAVIMGVWLFTGVFLHREYQTYNLFLKFKPSFKFYFYSPVGESDRVLKSMSSGEQRNEKDYAEFVENKHGFKHILLTW